MKNIRKRSVKNVLVERNVRVIDVLTVSSKIRLSTSVALKVWQRYLLETLSHQYLRVHTDISVSITFISLNVRLGYNIKTTYLNCSFNILKGAVTITLISRDVCH